MCVNDFEDGKWYIINHQAAGAQTVHCKQRGKCCWEQPVTESPSEPDRRAVWKVRPYWTKVHSALYMTLHLTKLMTGPKTKASAQKDIDSQEVQAGKALWQTGLIILACWNPYSREDSPEMSSLEELSLWHVLPRDPGMWLGVIAECQPWCKLQDLSLCSLKEVPSVPVHKPWVRELWRYVLVIRSCLRQVLPVNRIS